MRDTRGCLPPGVAALKGGEAPPGHGLAALGRGGGSRIPGRDCRSYNDIPGGTIFVEGRSLSRTWCAGDIGSGLAHLVREFKSLTVLTGGGVVRWDSFMLSVCPSPNGFISFKTEDTSSFIPAFFKDLSAATISFLFFLICLNVVLVLGLFYYCKLTDIFLIRIFAFNVFHCIS